MQDSYYMNDQYAVSYKDALLWHPWENTSEWLEISGEIHGHFLNLHYIIDRTAQTSILGSAGPTTLPLIS